jgi:hypothetical protein
VEVTQKSFEAISALFHLNPASSTVGFFYFTKMAKEIQLTQGKVAIVDDEDFEYLNQFKWHTLKLAGKFYVGRKLTVSKCKRNQIFMHRFIMKPDKGMVIDHLDGNPLNNQKNNLRICTHSENMRNCKISINNTSGFKGVSFVKKNNTYKSAIKLNKKTIYLGYYIDPIDAARAYNEAAVKYHGEFANLNKID